MCFDVIVSVLLCLFVCPSVCSECVYCVLLPIFCGLLCLSHVALNFKILETRYFSTGTTCINYHRFDIYIATDTEQISVSISLLPFSVSIFGVMYHLYYKSQYIIQGTNFNAFSEFLFILLSFILSPFFQSYLRQKLFSRPFVEPW